MSKMSEFDMDRQHVNRLVPQPPEPEPIWLHGNSSTGMKISIGAVFALGLALIFGFLFVAVWAVIDPPKCGVNRDLFTNCRKGL